VPARLRPWRQEPLSFRTAEARNLYDELADDLDRAIDEHDDEHNDNDHNSAVPVTDDEHERAVQARLGLRRQEPLPLRAPWTQSRPQRRKRALTPLFSTAAPTTGTEPPSRPSKVDVRACCVGALVARFPGAMVT
jgi:hypothetical protein